MTPTRGSGSPILVVCIDPSGVSGAKIFNPNAWPVASKGLVQSCWTEYSVLQHCVDQIRDMCARSWNLCQNHVATIQDQWRRARFDLTNVVVYAQVPDLHMRIAAFFAGLKALLDLLAQLLSTEKIVGGMVDGFHRTGTEYGGKVLNTLDNNCLAGRKDIAATIRALILEHKTLWIDQAIWARDQFVHPEEGMHQLMFQLDFKQEGDGILCERVNAPTIGTETIDQNVQRLREHAEVFSLSFLERVRGGGNV